MIRYTAKTLAVIAIVFGWLLVTGTALAQDSTKTPTYIGGSKCKMCHKGEKNGNIWETWEGSTHAKSMQSLIDKGEQNNPACLSCHTTGHGVAGGYGTAGMETPEMLGSVSCEACHGPGSEYKSKKVMEDAPLRSPRVSGSLTRIPARSAIMRSRRPSRASISPKLGRRSSTKSPPLQTAPLLPQADRTKPQQHILSIQRGFQHEAALCRKLRFLV